MEPLWHCNECTAPGDLEGRSADGTIHSVRSILATPLEKSTPGAFLCTECAKHTLTVYLASGPTISAILAATKQHTALGDVLRKRRWYALAVMWWLTGSYPPGDIYFYLKYRLYEVIRFTIVYPTVHCPLTKLTNDFGFMNFLETEQLTEAASLLTDAAAKACPQKRRSRPPIRYTPTM